VTVAQPVDVSGDLRLCSKLRPKKGKGTYCLAHNWSNATIQQGCATRGQYVELESTGAHAVSGDHVHCG
jgi:hypothetical protein